MKSLQQYIRLTVVLLVLVGACHAKILRNNALMSQMISHFQRDNNQLSSEIDTETAPPPPPPPSPEPKRQPGKILTLMQNVLCRNFPSIPCEIIMQDPTLKALIQRSIQQIKYKKLGIKYTTPKVRYDTTNLPLIDSEDLSNFLEVSNTGYFDRINDKMKKRKPDGVTPKTLKNFWSHERIPKQKIKGTQDSKRHEVYTGMKKSIRKFYPHKIKYKDKIAQNKFRDYSDEKLSMSVEVPDMTMTKHNQHFAYRVEPEEPPVWRIDYMKHGEPSLNMLGYQDDRLRGKIMKTGPSSVIVNENVIEQAVRKDVLHPDVYIKKNYIRKGPAKTRRRSDKMQN